jgi:hypothetical protein
MAIELTDRFISISDMKAYMQSGKPFSMVYITYDFTRGKGGRVKRVAMAVHHYAANKSSTQAPPPSPRDPSRPSRNPRHYENSTVNIRYQDNGQFVIRKVHYQLIRQFNGATVK